MEKTWSVGFETGGTHPPTAMELRIAAEVTEQIQEFLSRCMSTRVMPLLIGFDLDYLADQFSAAAERQGVIIDA